MDVEFILIMLRIRDFLCAPKKLICGIIKLPEVIRKKFYSRIFTENYWEKTHLKYNLEAPYSTTSCLCNSKLFDMPFFTYWLTRLKENVTYLRKQWEYVYVCQTLFEHGMLQEGKRGLVFGCGKEPLISLFASMGCKIMATDLDINDNNSDAWVDTNQHIKDNYMELNSCGICDEKIFKQNVTFMDVNMNEIPSELKDYDFCWSCSSFEHIGSLENGLNFVKNSLNTLKKGGLAIHITEFNLTSNKETYETPGLSFYREKDIRKLIHELEEDGHKVYPLVLDRGNTIVDKFVDTYPFKSTSVHLKLRIDKYDITSVGLIIEK